MKIDASKKFGNLRVGGPRAPLPGEIWGHSKPCREDPSPLWYGLWQQQRAGDSQACWLHRAPENPPYLLALSLHSPRIGQDGLAVLRLHVPPERGCVCFTRSSPEDPEGCKRHRVKHF